MKRIYVFKDNSGEREVSLAEAQDYDGVEIKVGGMTVLLPPVEWLAFAKLVSSTLARHHYGDTLYVDLGNKCENCGGGGLVGDEPDERPCSDCNARGFHNGEPEQKNKTAVRPF